MSNAVSYLTLMQAQPVDPGSTTMGFQIMVTIAMLVGTVIVIFLVRSAILKSKRKREE